MILTLDIPDDLIPPLREAYGEDLPHAALEQLAIEGYRSGKLSRYQVQQLLGFDNRWDAEAWMGQRGLTLQYSSSDLEADRKTLGRLLPASET